MKITKAILIYLALLITLSSVIINTRSTSKSSTNYWIRPLIKTAKSYLSFANLAYCKPEIINALSCPLCSSILDGSYKLLDTQSFTHKNKNYRFVILSSEPHKEVVISFSGPKSNDGLFYAGIYTSGWGQIHGQNIEQAYLNVYESNIAHALHRSIGTLLAKDAKLGAHKFVFAGHSIGGSLAVLAAFDLIRSKIITSSPDIQSPLVYSYGQLRIGDDSFVESVNKLFKVVRIVKLNDFMTRLPNCVFSPSTRKWRCFRDTQLLMLRFPEYRRYIMNYSGHGANKQYYTGIQAAYGNNRSFLQKSLKTKKSKRGYFYTANNPGYKSYNYGSTLSNQGSTSPFNNVYYSQPMGAEVIYSQRFRRFQVCSYFKGVPDCERQLPKSISASATGHAKYYGENVEDC
jgi:hypothetical protein